MKNYAIYEYNDKMHDYFKNYKFNGDFRLRKIFQNDFMIYFQKKSEVLIPIPVSESTFQERGFNQVIGFLEKLDFVDCLEVINEKSNQSKKNRKERLKLQQPFSVKQNKKQFIRDKEIILIDDIYTTGSTLRHASNLLLSNGAKKVSSVTLAR